MDTLAIVNACVSAQGQKPLNSLSDRHPLMAAIQAKITELRKSVLARGWWFNREPITLSPGVDQRIVLPGDCLSARALDRSRILAARGTLLYDITNGTDLFATDVDAIIVRDLPIEQVPSQAADYIQALTVAWFVATYDGTAKIDPTSYMVALNAEETRNQPANWLASNPRIVKQRWIRGGLRSSIYLPR